MRIALCGLAVAALAVGVINAQGTVMNTYFGLDSKSGSDAATEIFVNGVPYGKMETGTPGFQSLAIHGDVVPGENVVELRIGTDEVAPGATPAVPYEGGVGELFAVVTLTESTATKIENGYDVTDKDLETIEWRAETIDPEELKVPVRLHLRFDAPDSITPPSWTAGQPITAEEATASAINALRTIRQLLVDGDFERFGQINRQKYIDAATAFPLLQNAQQREAQDIDDMRYELGREGFVMDEISDDSTCRVFAEGRMIQCFGPDGEPALRGKALDDAKLTYFSFGFSVLNGKLVVVR